MGLWRWQTYWLDRIINIHIKCSRGFMQTKRRWIIRERKKTWRLWHRLWDHGAAHWTHWQSSKGTRNTTNWLWPSSPERETNVYTPVLDRNIPTYYGMHSAQPFRQKWGRRNIFFKHIFIFMTNHYCEKSISNIYIWLWNVKCWGKKASGHLTKTSGWPSGLTQPCAIWLCWQH